jgi:hypothetical protein
MLTYLFLTTIYSLEAQRVSIGLKGGPNYSRVNGTGPGYLTLGGLLGYNAGVFGLFKYPKLGIQPEVIFLSQGTETEFIALPTEVLKLNYICIPVMTKFYPANGFYIQAGPQFGYLISAKSNGANGRMVSTGQIGNRMPHSILMRLVLSYHSLFSVSQIKLNLIPYTKRFWLFVIFYFFLFLVFSARLFRSDGPEEVGLLCFFWLGRFCFWGLAVDERARFWLGSVLLPRRGLLVRPPR